MNRKVKWGIIGGANIAIEQLIPAINRSQNGEVTAIASSSGKAKTLAESLNIPKSYESYEALLEDPEIEAVYIPLPNHMHREWVIKAAKAEKHILCEKPAALNAGEMREMLSACRENNVIFMEAFMYRFHPQHQKVKEWIHSGAIGDVKMMRAAFSFLIGEPKGNIRLNPQYGGGAVYDVGCYCLNSFRNILKQEPETVIAFGRERYGVDVSVIGQLRFPNEVSAVFDCSFEMAMRNEYEVIGTEGTIRVPFAYRPDLNGGNGLIRITAANEWKEIVVQGDQYRLEVEHFSDCVLEGRNPEYSAENSLANMKAIEAVYQSLKTGREISIS